VCLAHTGSQGQKNPPKALTASTQFSAHKQISEKLKGKVYGSNKKTLNP
jgi:hypothetical protein